MPMGSARAATAQRVEQLSSLRCLAAGGRRRLSHCYNLDLCGILSRKDMFSVQCNLPHILRQHTAQSNRLLYHLRPAACRRRLIISRRHHEITLAGDGTLLFLGLRSLAPTAVSAASTTLFGPSGGGGRAGTGSGTPSTTLAFAAASRSAISSFISSIERSSCSSVIALTPPAVSSVICRGTSK